MGSIIEVFARPGARHARTPQAWRRTPMPGNGAVRVRSARPEDFAAVNAVQREAGARVASPRQLELQHHAFPEGQLVATNGAGIVGALASLVVDWEDPAEGGGWPHLTAGGTFASHSPGAATLFAASVAAHPQRGATGTLRALHQAARRLCRKHNLRRVVSAVAVESRDAAALLLREAAWGRVDDARLRVPMAQGFQCAGLLDDDDPGGGTALLVWINPIYSPGGPPGDAEAERPRECA
jgi:hypothetical protein